MAWIRKVLFWTHLSTALVIAIVVLIMSVSGVILSYQEQICNWIETKDLVVNRSKSENRLSPSVLVELLSDEEKRTARSIAWHRDPLEPVRISFGRLGHNYVDGFTGEILGRQSDKTIDFFERVESWHRWLAFSDDNRRLGRSITGLANLGFLFMLFSGAYLWWPRNWNRKSLRNVLWFRRKLSPKAKHFNRHHVIGFWSLAPMVFIVGTAVIFSYNRANGLVFPLYEKVMPSEVGKKLVVPLPLLSQNFRPFNNFSVLENKIEIYASNWQSFELEIPDPQDGSLKLRVYEGGERELFKSAEIEIIRESGSISKWEPFNTIPAEQSWRTFLRYGHTGEIWGILGQTIAGLLCLASIFLVWTGINLSWRRFKSWLTRNKNKRTA